MDENTNFRYNKEEFKTKDKEEVTAETWSKQNYKRHV